MTDDDQLLHPHEPAASYLARPDEVGARLPAVLGRPGHERDAQVDPGRVRGRGRRADGQPRPAGRGLRGRAREGAAPRRRRRPRRSTRARSSPTTSSCRRSRPTPIYGLGYPLFTALGRPLIAKLAVEFARETGCDTIAHGCTGKGNDQVRIDGTVATLAPELKVIAPVRDWEMGRDEEIAYAREHGIPVKGGTESRAVLDRRQPLGPLVGGQVDRGPRARARRRRLPARHAARGGARRGRDRHGRRSRRACRSRSTASGWASSSCSSAPAEIGMTPRRRHRRPHRGPDRRPEGARHLRGPGGGDPADRARRARAARRHDPPEPASSRGSTTSGPTSSTRACGGSRCAPTSTPTSTRSTAT